ncbi:DUF4493 domain-containing protein [Alistipes sp. An66]|uniref:DUF4493 domain-containing protein n=1 Tax=Alistipes sp. An66 TaxID=1965650 RepID=UPI0013A677B2|nr:DUF4493 domain-containing protein [Alistipes sp. An66]
MTGLLLTLTFGTLLLTGCVNEEPPYKKTGSGTSATGTTGYLNGEVGLRVIADSQTDMQPDDTEDETQNPPAEASATTRATVATDDYRVRIVRADGTDTPFEGSYAELKASLEATPMELPTGSYNLVVCSHREEEIPAVEWESPVYGTTYPFTITKGSTTTINEIVCTLQNIKVTLLCSADLADQLTAETKATISLGAASMEFGKERWDGRQAAFFLPADGENNLDFLLTGSFTDGGEVKFSKTITGVKAGQWRKIELVIVYADQGEIKFDISVDNFVLDNTVTINGTDGLWEEILEEGGGEEGEAPTIVMQGWDIAQPYVLETVDPVRVDIAAPNGGIRSLLVRIESGPLQEILVSVSEALTGEFDLCEIQPGTPEGDLLSTGVGFQIGDEVKGQQSTYFEINSEILTALKSLGDPGEKHYFHLRVIDNAGGETSATLTLVRPTDE